MSSKELEQALVSFGECVERNFPVVMWFRSDPFVGLSHEVSSQRKEDGDLVDRVISQCMARLDLDRRLSAYLLEHPLSPDDERELVDDFISCAGSTSAAIANLVSQANLETLDSVFEFVASLPPTNSGIPAHSLIAVSDCQEEMIGPKRVFREGHPWFIP